MRAFKIPEATIMRLSIYYRYLYHLLEEEVQVVSSDQIATDVGVGAAQVRKDLAYFGEFGTRGVGYKVVELFENVQKILGLDKKWNMVIVGAGKIGSALALYQGFVQRGFTVRAILDLDEKRWGEKLGDIEIEPLEVLDQRVKEGKISIGVVTVPAPVAQDVTDKMVNAGIKGILNFAPRVLKVPNKIFLRDVDLSVNLEVLSYSLNLQ